MKIPKFLPWLVLVNVILICLVVKKSQRKQDKLMQEVEFYTDSLNRYTKLYNSESFSKLKKENKELYNKLKEKEDLVEAIEFEWEYKYSGLERKISELEKSDSLYRFRMQTDTVGYDLKVWATHLAKYKIDFNITNKFILTHQRVGDENRMEINSHLPGKIQDVTIWTKPEKKKRFGVGLSVGAGYGVFNKNFDVFIGLSGNYIIW